eukprot:m.335995 g.335995  ORF g.335995 m.335995 type:complete len:54 (+) comp17729_c0_seq1:1008-1169(+)
MCKSPQIFLRESMCLDGDGIVRNQTRYGSPVQMSLSQTEINPMLHSVKKCSNF